MMLCDPHFDRLGRLLIARGLGDLITTEITAEHIAKMRATCSGRFPETLDDFDPIAFATVVILACAHEAYKAGSADLGPAACVAAPDLCPICDPELEILIEYGADIARDYAKHFLTSKTKENI